MKKLKNNRGEMLVEVLASVLIVVMAVTLMLGCVTAASSIDNDTRASDDKHYAGLSAAELQDTAYSTSPPMIEIKNVDPTMTTITATSEVDIYGDDGIGMYSYKRAEP